MNAISTLSNLIAELSLRTKWHVTWHLHAISARCVARDLHTAAPGPLERTCWRQFVALWGDCKKSRIAPLNAIIIIIIMIRVTGSTVSPFSKADDTRDRFHSLPSVKGWRYMWQVPESPLSQRLMICVTGSTVSPLSRKGWWYVWQVLLSKADDTFDRFHCLRLMMRVTGCTM